MSPKGQLMERRTASAKNCPDIFRPLVYLLLLGLALLPRLSSISVGDPQGDEILWSNRADVFTEAIRAGRISDATSHLGHPGIPVVLAMSGAKELNRSFPREWRLDDLTAARVGNAVLSSTISPLVFALSTSLVGSSVAILAAILICFDPQHIASSRMAHIDSGLALFVVASTLVYFRSRVRKNTSLALIAGALWGGALASRPTALCLPLAFVVWSILERYVFRTRRQAIVRSADLWAIFAGLIVFALLFTKLWHHHGPLLTEYKVSSVVADQAYNSAVLLRNHLGLILVGVLIITAVIYHCFGRIWALRAGGMSIPILLAALFPAVVENFIRYFIRIPWLTDFVRKDVGFGNPWIPGGYGGVLVFQLPPWIVVFVLVGLGIFLRALWDLVSQRRPASLQVESLAFTFVVIAVWSCTISISSRSYVRYIVPVLPLVYLFVALGIIKLLHVFTLPQNGGPLAVMLVMIVGVGHCSFQHPFYLNYFNLFYGGVSTAFERQYPLFYEGHGDALRKLISLTENEQTVRTVNVIGELPVVRAAYDRLRERGRDNLRFVQSHWPQSSDFTIITEPLLPAAQLQQGYSRDGLVEVFRYNRDGVPFAGIYRGSDITPKDTVEFHLFGLRRRTGGVSQEDTTLDFGERVVLYAKPERHQPGMLFRKGFLALSPGTFRVGLSVATLGGSNAASLGEAVLRIQVGPECSRTISAHELSEEITPIWFECTMNQRNVVEIVGEWLGTASIAVDALILSPNRNRTAVE